MEISFGVIIASIFLYINFLIVRKDIQKHLIPNKFLLVLLFLLPLWYAYAWYFGYLTHFDIIAFLGPFLFVFSICFGLFHFGFWGAGDVKYLLILLLYIPTTPFDIFFGNLASVVLAYIIISYSIFWMTHMFYAKKRYLLFSSIKKHIFESMRYRYKTPASLFTQLLLFLLVFICIRFIKLYFFEFYSGLNLDASFTLYVLVLLGVVFSIVGYYIRKLRKYFYISHLFIFLCLSLLLLGEYMLYPHSFQKNIGYILTLSLGIFLLLKIFWEGQKIVFSHYDAEIKEIKDLQIGMQINKKMLPLSEEDKQSLSSPLEKKDITFLQNQGISSVQVMKYFALSPYIFGGFMLCVLQQDFGGDIISLVTDTFLISK